MPTEPESDDPNAILIADIVDRIKDMIPVKKCHILDGISLICAELKMHRAIKNYTQILHEVANQELEDEE
jgi:hypothetical protein